MLQLILTLARLAKILAQIGEWITSLSSEQLHSLIDRIAAVIHEVQEEGRRHSERADHSIPMPRVEHQAKGVMP